MHTGNERAHETRVRRLAKRLGYRLQKGPQGYRLIHDDWGWVVGIGPQHDEYGTLAAIAATLHEAEALLA